MQGDVVAAVTSLLGATGVGIPAPAPSIPANAVKLLIRLLPKAGEKFSTRRLEEAFWGATVGTGGRIRSFPLANRYHGVSVARTRVVVGGDQGERDSVTVLEEDGSVSVAETTYAPGATPILGTQQVVMNLGLFTQFAYTFAQHLGLHDGVTARVSIQGLDRPFSLGFDPADLTEFGCSHA